VITVTHKGPNGELSFTVGAADVLGNQAATVQGFVALDNRHGRAKAKGCGCD
jgi:hypothetical protein